jgi:hypothetical protein
MYLLLSKVLASCAHAPRYPPNLYGFGSFVSFHLSKNASGYADGIRKKYGTTTCPSCPCPNGDGLVEFNVA